MDETATYQLRLPDGQMFGPASIDTLRQWAREGRVPRDAQVVPAEGGEAMSVFDDPELLRILQAPPTYTTGVPGSDKDSSKTPALIPYRNGPALLGYYAGVVSLVPFLSFLLGPAALVLGIVGIVKARREPHVRGMAHAIAAIALGLITPALSVLLLIFIIRMLDVS
ncbi:MAG: hypothetical protein ACYTGC_00045 [Planctomycetota bacterium]|jgi:hypothetical protein